MWEIKSNSLHSTMKGEKKKIHLYKLFFPSSYLLFEQPVVNLQDMQQIRVQQSNQLSQLPQMLISSRAMSMVPVVMPMAVASSSVRRSRRTRRHCSRRSLARRRRRVIRQRLRRMVSGHVMVMLDVDVGGVSRG